MVGFSIEEVSRTSESGHLRPALVKMRTLSRPSTATAETSSSISLSGTCGQPWITWYGWSRFSAVAEGVSDAETARSMRTAQLAPCHLMCWPPHGWQHALGRAAD